MSSFDPHELLRVVEFTKFNSCLNLGFLLLDCEDLEDLEKYVYTLHE